MPQEKTAKKFAYVLSLAFLFLTAFPVFAQNLKKISPPSQAATAAEYKLPYPGMLPDSRFYKLKTLRDKIVLFLIRDPYKKAEKHLNLADRILYESLKLAEKGNIPLSIHTAFKGEHNMTLLVNKAKEAVYSGRELDTALIKKAHKASKKHKDLILGMRARAKGKDKKQFDVILEFSQRNDNELFKLEREATSSPQEIQ